MATELSDNRFEPAGRSAITAKVPPVPVFCSTRYPVSKADTSVQETLAKAGEAATAAALAGVARSVVTADSLVSGTSKGVPSLDAIGGRGPFGKGCIRVRGVVARRRRGEDVEQRIGTRLSLDHETLLAGGIVGPCKGDGRCRQGSARRPHGGRRRGKRREGGTIPTTFPIYWRVSRLTRALSRIAGFRRDPPRSRCSRPNGFRSPPRF